MLKVNQKDWLKQNFNKNIKFDEPMALHTTLKVGGKAAVFITPNNLDELKKLIIWIRDNQIPYLTIGWGSNLLVKDEGINGIVIKFSHGMDSIALTKKKQDEMTITAMCGAKTKNICKMSLSNGLKGFNFAIGIPGTIGGAIKMNAGTKYGSMEDSIESIKLLNPDGTIHCINKKKLKFSYRHLSLCSENDNSLFNQPIIIEGTFLLKRTDPLEIKNEASLILKDRFKKQPFHKHSAGCFFKNPSDKTSAGQLIDMAGLKGKELGGAKISEKHANFLINTGKASSKNFIDLMELIQEKVKKSFNIMLEPEVKIV
ncbi:MAG: UDP-N-acetylmuramate dehydrogenase [Desulfobacterales bacterium]|nr:UDP-N-acetylmuramate dehydrogenase [Desulfobacterales bacterium]